MISISFLSKEYERFYNELIKNNSLLETTSILNDLLILACFMEEIKDACNGSTRDTINLTPFNNIKIILPPIDEQKYIAQYLDKEYSKIDEAIADIQNQIDTLEEHKRSVIAEAVTKGLNPNVELKDSGIAWIGRIPSHWNVEKIKYNLRRHELRNPGDQTILSVYREYGVIPKDSRDDNHNVTSEDISKYKYVKPGYFVINKMKAWQGSMGVSDFEGVVSPAYFIYVSQNKEFFAKYEAVFCSMLMTVKEE